jgi:RND family efflux transporter MFP subunit
MKKAAYIILFVGLIGIVAFLLVRNKSDLEEEYALAKRQHQSATVEVFVAGTSVKPLSFSVSGKLEAARELVVLSQTQGLVNKVHVSIGDYVRKGELLVSVDNELLVAENMVLEANYEKAKKDLERLERLSRANAVAGDNVEKMKIGLAAAESKLMVNKKRLSDTRITAPFSGYVNNLFVEANNLTGPGKPVAELVDLSGYVLKSGLNEEELIKLESVDTVKTTVKSYAGEAFPTVIEHVALKANFSLQYDIELRVDIPDSLPIRPGMIATATFYQQRSNTIRIPKSMVLPGNFVWLVKNGYATRKKISIDQQDDSWAIVKTGIVAGDSLISSNPVYLRESLPVKTTVNSGK